MLRAIPTSLNVQILQGITKPTVLCGIPPNVGIDPGYVALPLRSCWRDERLIFSTLRPHSNVQEREREERENGKRNRSTVRCPSGRFTNVAEFVVVGFRGQSRGIRTVVRTRLVSKRLVTVPGRPRRRTPPHSRSHVCKRATPCESVNCVTSRLGAHAVASRLSSCRISKSRRDASTELSLVCTSMDEEATYFPLCTPRVTLDLYIDRTVLRASFAIPEVLSKDSRGKSGSIRPEEKRGGSGDTLALQVWHHLHH